MSMAAADDHVSRNRQGFSGRVLLTRQSGREGGEDAPAASQRSPVGEFLEQLQESALVAAIKHDGALAASGLRPLVSGIAAVIVGSRAPDMLEPLLPRHGPDGFRAR